MHVSGTTIAFIGTGVMGASMAGHLLRAGATVRVYNRTKSKADPLLSAGALWAESPAEAVKGASVVFTMLGYPSDVEQVYLGSGGIIAASAPGAVLVDFTTSDPALAARISAAAAASGRSAIDAPVSGGDTGARNATLSIMVGGDEATFSAVKPFFDVVGKTAVLQGGPGAGQHTKMANQISVAASLIGAVESMTYARNAGLDPRRVLDSIGGGAAQSWQLVGMAPRMLDGDFKPGFYSKHFLKDLRIALDSAKAMGLELPLLALAESLFERMQEKGFGDLGTQALYRLYQGGGI
ncbi:MAG TPA: NAD(P)-dependent oxidoreductase [Spirochaetales bacterium]|nr:NAD(P)-dependent oxidoreductase [Spirochaetales bacterium]HPG85083.1 NAD(P)-dependent oxidoreductase [Spirochaetales bacterium]HPM72040.1 NAD(P)-dependent oxidoreductase [Spirochaetales bacterium]